MSEDIVRKSIELGISSGKGPTGVAAASIYIASVVLKKPRTQKEIAKVSGVTEVTIRNMKIIHWAPGGSHDFTVERPDGNNDSGKIEPLVSEVTGISLFMELNISHENSESISLIPELIQYFLIASCL